MDIITSTNHKNLSPSAATIGFFDGVHCGHRFLIKQLMEIALKENLCSAVITFPVHPRKVLNADYQPMMLSSREEKLNLLAKSGIDYCFLLSFTKEIAALSAYDFMKLLHDSYNIKTLLIGYDHRFGHNRSENFNDYCRYGKELGMEVIRAEEYDCDNVGVSSSAIRRLLDSGDVKKAAELLGYNYYIEGTVVDGHKVGRSIGFPTANIVCNNPERVIPFRGVYAVYVYVNGKKMKGMLNIGYRPTLDNGHEKTIEVNIFDFIGDIYKEKIRIEFVDFLRDERKFDSIDELTQQLKYDREKAIDILK